MRILILIHGEFYVWFCCYGFGENCYGIGVRSSRLVVGTLFGIDRIAGCICRIFICHGIVSHHPSGMPHSTMSTEYLSSSSVFI